MVKKIVTDSVKSGDSVWQPKKYEMYDDVCRRCVL